MRCAHYFLMSFEQPEEYLGSAVDYAASSFTPVACRTIVRTCS
jgi:hypothetical protein